MSDLGRGSEESALRLRQGADRLGDELFAHAGHQPIGPLIAHAGEDFDRDREGDAVALRSGGEGVGEAEFEVAGAPGVGEPCGVLADSARQEEAFGVGEELRAPLAFAFPPAVEMGGGDDALGEDVVEEAQARLLVGDEPVRARTALDLPGLLEEFGVAGLEAVPFAPFAVDEGVADEHVAGEFCGREAGGEEGLRGRFVGRGRGVRIRGLSCGAPRRARICSQGVGRGRRRLGSSGG